MILNSILCMKHICLLEGPLLIWWYHPSDNLWQSFVCVMITINHPSKTSIFLFVFIFFYYFFTYVLLWTKHGSSPAKFDTNSNWLLLRSSHKTLFEIENTFGGIKEPSFATVRLCTALISAPATLIIKMDLTAWQRVCETGMPLFQQAVNACVQSRGR